jgi:hypothetical protein
LGIGEEMEIISSASIIIMSVIILAVFMIAGTLIAYENASVIVVDLSEDIVNNLPLKKV